MAVAHALVDEAAGPEGPLIAMLMSITTNMAPTSMPPRRRRGLTGSAQPTILVEKRNSLIVL